MRFTGQQIAKLVGGEILTSNADFEVTRILLDSRKITDPTEALFAAIKGERHDSHRYLKEVYKEGVRCFLVEEKIDTTDFPGATIIRVNNTVNALQALAADYRSRFAIPVIGITGSNGKTIVKEWLNTLLADDYIIVRSPRSYNSQVGVPLSVLNLEAHHTLAIFEAGISQVGEMQKLANIIKPSIGIFTNVGFAHIENFSSKKQLAEEKIKLFKNAELVVYCADYLEISEILTLQKQQKTKWLGWSLQNKEANYSVRKLNTAHGITEIIVESDEQHYGFTIPFVDDASVENCIHCIVLMLSMGYADEVINSRLDRLSPLSMRLELLQGILHSSIINDVYSSDLHSLEIALDFMRVNSRHKKKIVILSDMVQTGLTPTELYRKVNELLIQKEVDYLIGVGKNMISASSEISISHKFYSTTEEFLEKENPEIFRDSTVLIKGARNFRFERITSLLQERSHETVLEIDLNALAHNLNFFRKRLPPSTKLMVMVKASGYGAGAYEIASLLEFNKVDYLAVAYTDEGVALRRAGVSVPIMVMNPEKSSLPALIRHKLEPEIFSFGTLDEFLKELPSSEKNYPVHIKIDTGMHRLGFMPEEVDDLFSKIIRDGRLGIASVFTHLAAADNPNMDEFTHEQLRRFSEACSKVPKSFEKVLFHALNTSGILRFPIGMTDMVRLGIGLYGISPVPEIQSELLPVSTLRTVISQIKNISPGESVGYSRAFIAEKDTRIATIPLGYADGLRRSLGNGKAYVLVNGKKAYITGNVCMDMTMVDVTDIPCEEGDSVEIFGAKLSLQKLAEMSNTIPYEILTSISQRVKRIYLQE